MKKAVNICLIFVAVIKDVINSSGFRTAMHNAVENFAINLDKILNAIKQRSSGKIFFFTQYNLYSGVNIVMPSTGESLNLGLITEEWIEKVNFVITNHSEVEVVDTSYPIEEAKEKCVNADINVLTNTFEFDPHLNQEGQRLVYLSLIDNIAKFETLTENQIINPLFIIFPMLGTLVLGETGIIIIRRFMRKRKNR